MLLRVAKKATKKKRPEAAAAAAATDANDEQGETITVTSVAAVVSSGISFPGLADVQYAGWDARAPRSQFGRLLSANAGQGGVGVGGGSVGCAGPPSSSSGSILPGEPLLAVPPVFFASDVAPAIATATAAPAETYKAK